MTARTRFVTYGRYSMDLQNPASIEDQERDCRADATRRNFEAEVRNYADRGISGSGSDRQDFQGMMKDALSPTRDFDIIMMDDTSRFSRSLSEAARLHEILKHHGVRVICVSQGIDTDQEQSEMQLAMHGIIDSVYVKELGKKTHRGLRGRVSKGLSAGGRCYGYDSIAVEDGGYRWVINEGQARVVREIFEWSAKGWSLKKIAGFLNGRQTPPPRKRSDRPHSTWCPSGVRAMLRNEIYVGMRIWNRTQFVKVPGTNKRIARSRPHDQLQKQPAPELRVVSDALWVKVQERQGLLKEKYADSGRKPVPRRFHNR
jgi:site-specific DNA recombinase